MLRELPRPVIGRIEKERLVLDLRCIGEDEPFLSNLSQFNIIAPNHACGALSDERRAKGAQP
jgi:L-seryl-tRNA(Ser) seleniumtransferase